MMCNFGFRAAALLCATAGTALANPVNLNCVYVIDGIHHTASVALTDAADEPGYKLLKINFSFSPSCEDYTVAFPTLLEGVRYNKYLIDCGNRSGLITLYESKTRTSWFFTRTKSELGFDVKYSCQ